MLLTWIETEATYCASVILDLHNEVVGIEGNDATQIGRVGLSWSQFLKLTVSRYMHSLYISIHNHLEVFLLEMNPY